MNAGNQSATSVGSGISCQGCALSGRKLTGATFAGGNFKGAALVGADLRGASFTGTTFAGADFSRADLRSASLLGVSFSNAVFADAKMDGLEGAGAVFAGADLKRAQMSSVELVGALPPIGTFVTSYKVHPFVGLVPEGTELEPNPAEVAAILHLHLDALRDAYEMRRLVRRGIPFRTPTYEVERHMI